MSISMPMKPNGDVIVFDIGGTHFRHAVFTQGGIGGSPPIKEETPSVFSHPKEDVKTLQQELVGKIANAVRFHRAKNPSIKLVGISFPAPVNSKGVALRTSGIWEDKGDNFPLLDRVKRQLCQPGEEDISVFVANDLTAAAESYAYEYRKSGKPCNFRLFDVVTISTGIGSKIYDMQTEEVLLNNEGTAGEIGHRPVTLQLGEEPLRCDCGAMNHLGSFASGRGIERVAQREAQKFPESFKESSLFKLTAGQIAQIKNELISKAILEKDPFCNAILEKNTLYLAQVLAQIANAVGITKFIITGGFALSLADRYLDSLINSLLQLKDYFYMQSEEEIRRMPELGNLGDTAGLCGIGLFASKRYERLQREQPRILSLPSSSSSSQPPQGEQVPHVRQMAATK
ncbi:MAG: ROK family protein [Gammaproteobacteria bacterium]